MPDPSYTSAMRHVVGYVQRTVTVEAIEASRRAADDSSAAAAAAVNVQREAGVGTASLQQVLFVACGGSGCIGEGG